MHTNTKSHFSDQLLEEEVMIWEASPSLLLFDTAGVFEFNLEKIINFIRFAMRFEIIISVVVIPVIIAYLIFYVLPIEWKIVVAIVFLVVTIMKYLRIKKSRYGYSNKRIFIRIWNWGRLTTNTINYAEIGKISTEIYANGGGIIHFLPKKPFSFGGKALLTGFNRHYPTIEFVADIEAIAEDIRSVRKEAV